MFRKAKLAFLIAFFVLVVLIAWAEYSFVFKELLSLKDATIRARDETIDDLNRKLKAKAAPQSQPNNPTSATNDQQYKANAETGEKKPLRPHQAEKARSNSPVLPDSGGDINSPSNGSIGVQQDNRGSSGNNKQEVNIGALPRKISDDKFDAAVEILKPDAGTPVLMHCAQSREKESTDFYDRLVKLFGTAKWEVQYSNVIVGQSSISIFGGDGAMKDLAVGVHAVYPDPQATSVKLAQAAFHAFGMALDIEQGQASDFIPGIRRTGQPPLAIIVGKLPE